eukprot:46782_1
MKMTHMHDTMLLMVFIMVICSFMWCFHKRTERIRERNAKIFEMRAVSPGNCVLEYEDIASSDMDNDINDDVDLMEKQKALKEKMYRKQQLLKQMDEKESILNAVSSCDDHNRNHEEKTDVDIFSDSTDDGMSMARMREEYYKSQTLTKRFTDLLDDIRDVIKVKQIQVQSHFIKKKPMIVIPMAMPPSISKPKAKKSRKLDDIDEEEDSHSVDSESDEKVREEQV